MCPVGTGGRQVGAVTGCDTIKPLGGQTTDLRLKSSMLSLLYNETDEASCRLA